MQLGLEDLFGEDSDAEVESTTHPDQAQSSSQTINSSGPSSTINSGSGPPAPSGAAVHSDQHRPNESTSNAASVAGDTQRTKQKRRRNRRRRYRPYGNTTVIKLFIYHVH